MYKNNSLATYFPFIAALLCLFIQPVFAQESPDHHAESDRYWADLAKAYPAFEVNLEELRVAAANELNTLGEWGPVLDWPHIPVSAAHLPDGRILTWASNDEEGFPGGQPEFTYAAAWDPIAETFKMVPHNSHDMFCAHQVMLEDGDVLVMGGRNTVKLVSKYDYETDTWIPQEQMEDSRWYPTSVAMPNGEVMIAIGSGGSANPEMWNELTGWRKLTGVNLQSPILNYTGYYENHWWPLFHVAPNGQVFHSGPTPDMHYIDVEGNGSITKVGPQITDWYPKHGTTVMYEEGMILTAGGAIGGGNLASSNRAMVIDLNGGTPVVREIASMAHARKFQNGVPLPTGEVLVIGGNTSGTKFSDNGTILTPEIFDPVTETWTQLADMAVPRNYHSVALLMTDGRVWSGGGGLCGVGCAANHIDAQIYSPPYLFNADGSLATRPVISSAPEVVRNGENIVVSATAGLTRFSAIKMSSTTHGVDSDVRQLSLSFTETASGSYDVAVHSNENVMTPGYWMLFGVNAQGVPSEAAVFQVSTEGIPTIANPGTQISTEGAVISLQLVATDSDGGTLTYTASGLPTGLSIDGGSGLISGTIANGAVATYTVTATVSDGLNSDDTQFTWEVIPEGAGIVSEYFEGSWTVLPDFDSLVPIRIETINNFDISNRDQEDFFGFQFTGFINIESAGDYTFYTTSDDGSQLFINDNLVVNNDGLHAAEEQSGVVNLDVGYHAIEVTFFEHGGAASLVVQYAGPGIDKQTIPESKLFVVPPSPNSAPSIDPIADQNNFKGEVISLQISASDPDGDPITFSATGLPSGLTINGDGLISGTIGESSNADNTVDITVTDGSDASATSFNWTVITPAEAQGEIGTVTVDQSGSSQWHTVNLDNTYSNPVVVMGPPSFAGSDPLTVRVRNAGATSFEFQFDEWDYLDGVHGAETVSYMVVEAGSHQLADGRSLQAGIASPSGNDWSNVSFIEAFSGNPVVLTQVGTANDPAAVTSRNKSVGPTGFDLQLEEEEGSANDHGTETVYWVAIAPGSDATTIPNEAGVTGNDVTEEWHTISFSQTYSANPIVLGDFQTVDGGDPATMRYQSLTTSSVQIFAEEEQASGDETNHTTEIAGFVVFDAAGPVPFDGFALPPIVLTNPGDQSGAEGEAVSLTIQVEEDNGNPLTFTASGLPDGLSISTSGLISGGLVAGSAGSASVTVDVTDGSSDGSISFNWNIDAARGTWVDYTDDSNSLSLAEDGEEKDIAVGDLNKDGWDDIIVVRKEGFMGTGAREDLLLMNEAGTLIDRTADYAPGFAVEPTIARDAIITDLDGDGWDDVLIANTFGDQPSFYRNLGSDATGWLGLADESSTRLPTLDVGSIQYCGVSAGDVNGDGSPDLYFSNYVMDGTTKDVLLINDGNGNFTDEGSDRLGDLINVAFGTQGAITDIDGDGDNDIVKLSANQPADPFPTDGIFVLYNDGTGNFSNWSTVPSNDAYMFIMEDFDNNGEQDFYIVDDAADYVNLSSGVTANSNINFTQTTTTWARTASNGANLRVGDLDGDGDLDIGVADVDTSFPPCETPENLRAFLLLENEGDASGTFIDPFGAADKPWSKNMFDFAFIDVNNDGNLDIFSAECNGYGLFTSTQDAVEPPPSDEFVVDGDFETGPVIAESPGWQTYGEGSIIHGVWEVTSGTVDIHYYTMDGSGLGLQPEGGLQHMDLQGDNPGRVIQPIDGLIAGQTYKLSFYYAAYPHSAVVGTAQAQVTISGLDHSFTAETSGEDEWVQYSGTFVASATSEELAFEGLGSARAWGGVLIDLVEIVSCANGGCEIAVPEVASFSPASGYVGDAVTITGANFTDAISVSFGSTNAPIFTVVSDSEITATVPGGASTGVITVATPSASGSSSESFEVSSSSSANLIVSGDFEGDPLADDGGWISYFEGETLYGVWEVVSGSVDIHHYLHASAGVPIYPDAGLHHLDLQGSEPGIMKQRVGGMSVGQNYKLSFTYAIYPYFAITEASANVLIGSMLDESWVATNAGDTAWEEGSFVFEATATTADVQFSGFGSERSWGGMLIDEIVLEACTDCVVGASPNMQLSAAPAPKLEKLLPEEFAIRDAFPNPFNEATDIVFGMPEAGYARMEVYNATGQLIQVLLDGEQPQGYRRIRWEGDDNRGVPVASGVYLIRFEAGGSMQTRKVVVVK